MVSREVFLQSVCFTYPFDLLIVKSDCRCYLDSSRLFQVLDLPFKSFALHFVRVYFIVFFTLNEFFLWLWQQFINLKRSSLINMRTRWWYFSLLFCSILFHFFPLFIRHLLHWAECPWCADRWASVQKLGAWVRHLDMVTWFMSLIEMVHNVIKALYCVRL